MSYIGLQLAVASFTRTLCELDSVKTWQWRSLQRFVWGLETWLRRFALYEIEAVSSMFVIVLRKADYCELEKGREKVKSII